MISSTARWHPIGTPPLRNLPNTCSLKLSKPSRSLQHRATMQPFKSPKTCQYLHDLPVLKPSKYLDTFRNSLDSGADLYRSGLPQHIAVGEKNRTLFIKRKNAKGGKHAETACSRRRWLTTFWCCESKAKERIFGTQVLPSLRAEQTQQISQDSFGPHIVVVTLAYALYFFHPFLDSACLEPSEPLVHRSRTQSTVINAVSDTIVFN